MADEEQIDPRIFLSNLKIQKVITKDSSLVGIIKVEAEETLGHYADWLKIPTGRIRSLNRFPYGKTISIDQRIKIPLAKKGRHLFEELRYEYHREIEEDFFESFSVTGVKTHEIKQGDTIWFLCQNELEIPFWLLKKYNPRINFNQLQPGQKIKYPIVDKTEDIHP